ncbi:putative Bromodomain transcription factor protein [Trachipleistophora hominis]|uniref:Putative Bromodomain transcription factor protein n=1 Tax=Trachipleistophora hominis TaxID=72359 RepID=L7JRR6_TRAHO|nr:putative Bromodomain transcription factor protein [Trachipleistophora hominis]
MKNNFHTQILKLCIAEILIQSGFERTTSMALTTLTHLLTFYIAYLTKRPFNRPFLTTKHLFSNLCHRERTELLSYLQAQRKTCDRNQAALNILEQLRIMPDEKDETVEECVEENKEFKTMRDSGGVSDVLHNFIVECKRRIEEEKSKEQHSDEETKDTLFDTVEQHRSMKNIPPFFVGKPCVNRLRRDAKEYAEMMEWRRGREESGMVTDELLCFSRRRVEKE